MAKVHLGPLGSASGGIAGLGLLALAGQLSVAGGTAGFAYLAISNALLVRALRRHATRRFGWANAATATRSTLVGLITGLVATSLSGHPIAVPLLIALAVPALALDAVDGWLARRTDGATELGARFDMEVDAYLLLALSTFVAPLLGPWVLAIGLIRYAYVAAGWVWPWLRGALPYRYWRKVVTAVQGIALTAAASGLLPTWLATAVVGVALALLTESFGRDVLWLAGRQRAAARAAAMKTSVTANPTR